ncbi:hypothetical protein [Cryptosporangium minutisporangium]|uniref:Uncharacterized protein n=1 Tax=Cryptosporangium minutisporangium TaxID=113569 RepID=A0ABP6T028_9ACTN
MTEASPRQMLDAATGAAQRARAQRHYRAAPFVLLGVVEMLVVVQPYLWRRIADIDVLPGLIPTLAVMVLVVAGVYGGSRPSTPRHGRAAFGITAGVTAAIVALTVTVGETALPDSAAWWIAGAVLSGVPMVALGAFVRNRSAVGDDGRARS